MAKRVDVVIIDDLDESPADETVRFALDGVNYQIDLSAANAAEMRRVFARYVDAAQRTSGRRTRGTAPKTSNANAVREWAVAQGYEVNPRGRVPANIREAYEKAHSK